MSQGMVGEWKPMSDTEEPCYGFDKSGDGGEGSGGTYSGGQSSGGKGSGREEGGMHKLLPAPLLTKPRREEKTPGGHPKVPNTEAMGDKGQHERSGR